MCEIKRGYSYTPKWTGHVVAACLLGLLALVFVWLAITNDGPIVHPDIVGNDRDTVFLSPGEAMIFYWVLAGVMFALAVLAGYLPLAYVINPRRIALTPDSIAIPGPSFMGYEERTDVPYARISALSVSECVGPRAYRSLDIVHSQGKAVILESALPTKRDFDEICKLVAARLEQVTSGDCQPTDGSDAATPGEDEGRETE